MGRTLGAFGRLARGNPAASLTVVRDGEIVFALAAGTTIDGAPATTTSPMLVASVSKLITAFSVAALQQDGRVDVDAPVPWTAMGLGPHPAWNDVTVRELLDHTSGMPVARSSWFGGGGDCRSFLPTLLSSPPQTHRGQWRYSNGNYCALGLLVEAITALPLDTAARALVFEPLGLPGPHLSTDGLLPGDVPHPADPDRLSRLGGAGVFVVSTDDVARMLASTDWDTYDTLRPPGIFTDQYGWGHTGTVIGAISCAWLLEGGRTAVAATISGNDPSTGGSICDLVVPAVADDLGIGAGRPDRTP